MSTKRLALDEKKSRLLNMFYEKGDFYNLKEIEKIGSKEKGIVLQTIKDVLQSLVDDGFVQSEKIGGSIYFWAFPGQKIDSLEKKISEVNKNIVSSEFELQNLEEQLKSYKSEEEKSVDKSLIIKELQSLKTKQKELNQQIKKLEEVNPEIIIQLEKKAEEYRNAANCWIDNIFSIQSWCRNKFNIETNVLNKQFHIPEDLDYVN